MSGLLERFQKNVVGSKGRIADYTASIASTGDFNRITNLQVILNSWKNILLTPLRSVSHDPEYGSNLYKYVYDMLDQDTIESIRDEIYYRLMINDNRAIVTNVNITVLPNMKGINVNVQCKYQGEVGEMSATIDPNSLNFLE